MSKPAERFGIHLLEKKGKETTLCGVRTELLLPLLRGPLCIACKAVADRRGIDHAD